jgi:hypothetical protein
MESVPDIPTALLHRAYATADAQLAAKDATIARLVGALTVTRAIVVDGAMTGFNCHDGDWAERLYTNNGAITAAIKEAAQ